MSDIHYWEYYRLGINPHVLCKGRPESYENIGVRGKENWTVVMGTKKKSEVTCKKCLEMLDSRAPGFYIKRRWNRRILSKKEFCDTYGHWYNFPKSYSGVVISKGISVIRYTHECLHCHYSYYEDTTTGFVDTSKWGYSFGSEGVCSHCKKSQTCPSSLARTLPGGTYFTRVHLKCPLNKFKPYDEKRWKEQINGLGDMMR